MQLGEKGIIHSITNETYFINLMEMGCIPGETIEIEKIALSGDPICIYVSGYNLSLRKEEASNILVKI